MKREDKIFLAAATVGLLIALTAAAADRLFDLAMPSWLVYIWPTWLMLGAVSGHASLVAVLSVVSASALLNAALYGLTAWAIARGARLLKRA
jgi:hypothetical protein